METPLDVALARRVIRDYKATSSESVADVVARLHNERTYYLENARYPYMDTDRHKSGSDLILDGCRSLEDLIDEIIARIGLERNPGV